jgi:hypothetical protein
MSSDVFKRTLSARRRLADTDTMRYTQQRCIWRWSMKTIAGILVLSPLMVGACTQNFVSGVPLPPENIRQVHAGVTDKTTVARLLGPSTNRYATGGVDMWSYQYSNSNVNFGVYGIGARSGVDMQRIQVQFKGDVVSSCSYTFITSNGPQTPTAVQNTTTTDCDAQ